jgi:transmembrane sensor
VKLILKSTDMSQDETDKLWKKYYNGDTSGQEEEALGKLLKQNTDEDRLPEKEFFSLIDKNHGLCLGTKFEDDLMAKIQSGKSKTGTLGDYRAIMKCAAVVALVCVITFVVIQVRTQKTTLMTEQSARQFQLPDGSSVWLNTNSRLTYEKDFLQKRAVQFSGEGFFNITHDPSHPFSIETESTATQVLGTSFNLRSYAKEDSVELIVIEGKVSFLPAKADEVIISSQHKAVYSRTDQKTVESTVQDLNVIAWKTRLLDFVDAPMNKVLEDLQRYNGVPISVENEDVLTCHFSGSFENKTLEEILATLAFSLDLEYKKNSNGYYLSGKGCATR